MFNCQLVKGNVTGSCNQTEFDEESLLFVGNAFTEHGIN